VLVDGREAGRADLDELPSRQHTPDLSRRM